MKNVIQSVLLIAAATAAFAAGKLTERERGARFWYDLGPEAVDVSGYPQKQQESYRLFAGKCSQCHTLARPINSPLTERKDWRRYVRRMHAKIEASSQASFSADEQARIVDFLVFDAKARKLDGKGDFAKQAAALKARFDEVKAQRKAEQQDEDQRKARKGSYENTQPSPRP